MGELIHIDFTGSSKPEGVWDRSLTDSSLSREARIEIASDQITEHQRALDSGRVPSSIAQFHEDSVLTILNLLKPDELEEVLAKIDRGQIIELEKK